MNQFHELIKKFDKIRDYINDFYIYGFKTRKQFSEKSLRSYDNEKRRIESYLGQYIRFIQIESGKQVYLSVENTEISSNPLYRAFQAKSFTKNDITLHFILLDILQDGEKKTVPELENIIYTHYLSIFSKPLELDTSTIRNKLKEYVKLGILGSEKKSKSLQYFLLPQNVSLSHCWDAIAFFSETILLGVIGYYLLQAANQKNTLFCFKHHYIMHAMESEILFQLLEAIHQNRYIELTHQNRKHRNHHSSIVLPLKIIQSVQSGRQYLCAAYLKSSHIANFRLDTIKSVKFLDKSNDFLLQRQKAEAMLAYTWGASFGQIGKIHHLCMVLEIYEWENYILERLHTEGRHGVTKPMNKNQYEYSINVCDPTEMLPWIRTFIGRIICLSCSDETVVKQFYCDFRKMLQLYGEDKNDF